MLGTLLSVLPLSLQHCLGCVFRLSQAAC
jgi:hypothetical protein